MVRTNLPLGPFGDDLSMSRKSYVDIWYSPFHSSLPFEHLSPSWLIFLFVFYLFIYFIFILFFLSVIDICLIILHIFLKIRLHAIYGIILVSFDFVPNFGTFNSYLCLLIEKPLAF